MIQDSPRLRILNLGLVSSLDSQAIYHAVAACMKKTSVDTVIVCRPSHPYFCIGHHQNVRHVLNAAWRSKLDYPVVRRRLGGGVTYLDHHQLFYQCVFHRSRSPAMPQEVYKRRLRQPINLLNRIGVKAELRYTNEIEVAGRRIAGIGGGLIGEASVVVGNVLGEFDYEVMSNIINAPCETFRTMAYNAMSERITTLRKEQLAEFWQDLPEILIDEYRQDFGDGVYIGELSAEERHMADQYAKRLTAESYLNKIEHDARLLVRLKVSGSTIIELIAVPQRRGDSQLFFVVRLKDGVIEDFQQANDLDEGLFEPAGLSGFITEYRDRLEVGTRLTPV